MKSDIPTIIMGGGGGTESHILFFGLVDISERLDEILKG